MRELTLREAIIPRLHQQEMRAQREDAARRLVDGAYHRAAGRCDLGNGRHDAIGTVSV